MSILKIIPLLQAFSSAIFHICGTSCSPRHLQFLVLTHLQLKAE